MRRAIVAMCVACASGCGSTDDDAGEVAAADAAPMLDAVPGADAWQPDAAVVDAGDPMCGNGRLDPGESCDPSAGHHCRSACDAPACWTVALVGAGCHVTCEATPIVGCDGG